MTSRITVNNIESNSGVSSIALDTGVTIGDAASSFPVNEVTVDGFNIKGDAGTNSGVMVLPWTNTIYIMNNNIFEKIRDGEAPAEIILKND